MQPSTKRRTQRAARPKLTRVPLATAIYLALGAMSLAYAQSPAPAEDATTQDGADAAAQPAADADAAGAAEAQDTAAEPAAAKAEQRTLGAVTVTAQKREENVQEVPINIQVLGGDRLTELNVTDFISAVQFVPSVSITSFGPGFGQVYMRGVASGGDGNHSASSPSVGIYLDEQPITTIQGALDVHFYDIERVEVLAGPQGTLFGASSQSGTIRIITNKPDPTGFSAAYGLEGNYMDEGDAGYVAEGYANLPIGESAAIRLVAWNKRDGGYIDNVFGERTFPTSGITIDNAERVEDDYNDVTTTGARVQLGIELGDNWTVTPAVMSQRQEADGGFAYDTTVGDLALSHFFPETSDDRWTQAALTVEGKIGNFDLVYAFANLNRDVDTESDYNDYTFWYDTLYGYGAYLTDDNGDLISGAQYIQGRDIYRKRSHELRLSSPADDRFRYTVGLFYQEQSHDIQQRYRIDDLADAISVTGWPDTIWLTKQEREDDDKAVFADASFDFNEAWTLSAGIRFFESDNSLKGFFGFSEGFSGSTGEAACFDQTDFNGAPCINLDKETNDDDHIGRVNLQYRPSDTAMLYGTWSEGYRPGGINRRGTLPPYLPDFLTNYEFGWKTSWADNTLVFNGAVFQEEWDDFQFAILGANGLTEIKNANQARIRGIEAELNWAVTYDFTLSGGMAYYDSELTANYCGFTDEDGVPITECDDPEAPEGTELPLTADFKANLTGRYNFETGSLQSYVQASLLYEGDRSSDLRVVERDIIGDLPSYTVFNLSYGFGKDNWKLDFFLDNAFDERGQISRFAQCAEAVCGQQVYVVPITPRMIGVRWSQAF